MKANFAVIAGIALGLLTSQVSLAETKETCADAAYVGVLAVMNQGSVSSSERVELSKLMANTDACRDLLKKIHAEAAQAKASGELTPLLKEQFSEIEAIDTTISKDQMVNSLIEANTEK
jgi:hypothetical protein